ncbi:MAG: TonB-dependent receptor [Saprospiraceae bacterium]|nr:TonB-dependent receptor [Saprospiraceae bacterium]
MNNIYIYILVCFISVAKLNGQLIIKTDSLTHLDEVVISASRVLEPRSNVAQQIRVLNSKYIVQQNALNVADLLLSSGDVFVQRSQQGGGSPVLRGFEASRLLLIVDGVRMNNLIYRAGHLQNAITIDPNILERVEILSGPGSTVYGSDALGGVIHFRTKNPTFGNGEKVACSGSASSSIHSVNQGANLNATLNLGWKKLALFSGVTYTSFGDLRMGASKNPFYDAGYFGERIFYADRINGKDVLVKNENRLIQKFSGYSQIDLIQKVIFKPSESIKHSLNVQYSNSTNIPRYDRLTDPKGDGLNSSEWYYGPQKRLLAIYNFEYKSKGIFESINVNTSFQSVRESRHNRNFGSENLKHRIEDVHIAGLQIFGVRKGEKNEMRLGIDALWNSLKSRAMQENISTGAKTALDTRYPDGNNTQITTSVYFTHNYKINSHLILTDGIRLGYNNLKSSFSDKTFFPFPFDAVQQKNLVYSGNLGMIYANKGFKACYLISTGFRTPNVDDLSKVFESQPGRVIVPNPNLKPESTLSQELNLGYFDRSWSFENVLYYTSLSNFISLAKGTLDGQSFIQYDDSLSQVFTSVNKSKGYIYGFSSMLKKKFNDNWSAYGTMSYTFGRSKDEGIISPLDHIPPLIGKFGIDYNPNKFEASYYMIFNAKKDIKNYSPSGEDNAQYAPNGGMPAWMTNNIRFGYKISNLIKIQFGIENMLDIQHRYFASGINAPGRNFWTAVRVNF